MSNRNKSGKVFDIRNGLVGVRYGENLTDVEWVRYNSLKPVKIGDKGDLIYISNPKNAYYTFVKKED